jgi:hypothetical protein
MLGILLVLIGVVWLLSSLGIISASISQVIWPIIVIAIGLWLVLRPRHWRDHVWRRYMGNGNPREKDESE